MYRQEFPDCPFKLVNPKLFSYDGVDYKIIVDKYEEVGGYAPCMIHDLTNKEMYQSFGTLELNGHYFVTKFKLIYDDVRDNYAYNKEVILEIY